MALDGIEIKLEQLSEALVFTEIDDSDTLLDLHTHFLEVIALTDDGDEKIIVDALEASAKLLQAILDGESDHPQDSLELIGNTLPVLLAVYRDGRSVDEVQFPSGLFPASRADGASGTDQPAAAAPPTVDTAILAEFLHRQVSVTEDIETHILHLEESGDEEHLQALRRLIHTIKGESGMLGLYEVERLCHAVEDNLEEHPIDELIDPLLALKDWLCGAFAAYSRGESPESDGSSIIASFQVSGEGDEAESVERDAAQGGEAVESPEDADAAYLAKELGAITRGVAETQLDDDEGLEALQDTLERFGTWLAEQGQPYAKDLAMASATTISDILNRELKAPEIAYSKVREAIDVLDSLVGDHPEEDVQDDKQCDTNEAKAKFVAALGPMVEHFERLLLSLNEGVTAKALGELKLEIRSVREAAAEFEEKDMEALCQAADAALMKWPVVAHLDTLGEMGKWLGAASRWFAGEGAPPGPPMSIWSHFQSGPVDASCEDAGDAPEGGRITG